eukprot:7255664-Prymnesium_polylepis.1
MIFSVSPGSDSHPRANQAEAVLERQQGRRGRRARAHSGARRAFSMREPTRPQLLGGALCSTQGWTSPVSGGAVPGEVPRSDFDLARRESGTAPNGVARPKRGDSAERGKAVRNLLNNEAWFVDDGDNSDDSCCTSPTLFLSEPPAHGALLSDFVADRGAAPPSTGPPQGAFCDDFCSTPRNNERPPERGGQRGSKKLPGQRGLEEDSRSRVVEGGMNLSPRGDRSDRAENRGDHSQALKGLLNSSRL